MKTKRISSYKLKLFKLSCYFLEQMYLATIVWPCTKHIDTGSLATQPFLPPEQRSKQTHSKPENEYFPEGDFDIASGSSRPGRHVRSRLATHLVAQHSSSKASVYPLQYPVHLALLQGLRWMCVPRDPVAARRGQKPDVWGLSTGRDSGDA